MSGLNKLRPFAHQMRDIKVGQKRRIKKHLAALQRAKEFAEKKLKKGTT